MDTALAAPPAADEAAAPPDSHWRRVGWVAEQLGVSETAITDKLRSGDLPGFKLNAEAHNSPWLVDWSGCPHTPADYARRFPRGRPSNDVVLLAEQQRAQGVPHAGPGGISELITKITEALAGMHSEGDDVEAGAQTALQWVLGELRRLAPPPA